MEDAEAFTKEFNARNTAESTPDWYMQVEDVPQPMDLTDPQFEALNASEDKRMWLSSLRTIKDFKLDYCDICIQMTNHIDGECQKHDS